MSKSLFALTDESRLIREQIEAMVDPETGEIPANAIDLMMENQLAIMEKLNGYLDFMSEIDSTVSVCKDKIKSFNAKIKALESIEKRMRENIRIHMSNQSIVKIEADKTISLVSQPDKVVVDDDLLADCWKKEKVTFVPDMELIEKSIADGIEIPGVSVWTDRSYVRIK